MTKVSASASDNNKTCYKRLRIEVDPRIWEERHGLYTTGVSFDTVPTMLIESVYDRDDYDFKGINFPFTTDSKNHRILTATDMNILSTMNSEGEPFFKDHGFRTARDPYHGVNFEDIFVRTPAGKIIRRDYPSHTAIDNDALLVNRLHCSYYQLCDTYKQKLLERVNNSPSKYFLYPDLLFLQNYIGMEMTTTPTTTLESSNLKSAFSPNSKKGKHLEYNKKRHKKEVLSMKYCNKPTQRTLLCHIDGRRHTWVALDYMLQILSQPMDHLVIVTNLPAIRDNESLYKRKRTFQNENQWAPGYTRQDIDDTVNNLQDYITLLIPPTRPVKITIEVVTGKTLPILVDAIGVYHPDLIIRATLKHERTKSLVGWKTYNLNDTLTGRYPVPICLVPVKRMSYFELQLQHQFEFQTDQSTIRYKKKPFEISLSKGVFDGNDSSMDSLIKSCSKLEVSNKNKHDIITSKISHTDEENDEIAISSADSKSFNSSELDSNNIEYDSSFNDLLNLVKRNKTQLISKLQTINDDNKISEMDKKILKLDTIVEKSTQLAIDIDNSFTANNDSYIENLKKVLTGGHDMTKAKSMTEEYGGSGRRHSHPQQTGDKLHFSNSTKTTDGTHGLGNLSNHSGLDSNKIKRLSLPEETLRKTHSAGGLRKQKSNDSSRSQRSTRSSGSFGSKKGIKKKSSGFFSFMKSSSSGAGKAENGRRSSVESQNSGNDEIDTRKKYKMFGFSKF
ncbi:similar to Saccharomyces cerevisiae YDR475C JIP4 Protein of unknown function [Maudiozyma saulgeensis]|uniref:Uncharacterized protein n=1 Tax=Maudiozyma saulgeensis TaxID=1789683 RepID=A0A1X7QWM7_9SACH|nr:similar to Saccharomyces cerevisiae YDR475C JIP4 Protein of unknown function [Kazachstania saulgeensis]